MGIINVTPDSFFTQSRKASLAEVLKTSENMLKEGATFLDIGGYSSRPDAENISEEDEIDRIIQPIEAIRKEFPNAIISVDTFRSKVAKKAVEFGADMVNDISGGNLDEDMLTMVAELGVPYVAMHMKGNPQTMKDLTKYDDLLTDLMKYFSSILNRCNQLGIKDVLIDPGFGFAKTAEQSFEIMKKLDHLHYLDRPLLVGVSRKSMIYRTLNLTAEEALNGTTVLNTVALLKGAAILRVHDVKEAYEAVELLNHLN